MNVQRFIQYRYRSPFCYWVSGLIVVCYRDNWVQHGPTTRQSVVQAGRGRVVQRLGTLLTRYFRHTWYRRVILHGAHYAQLRRFGVLRGLLHDLLRIMVYVRGIHV